MLRRLMALLPDALRPDRSLMARLVGSFLTLSLLIVLFVALVAFIEARRALREAMFDRLMAVAVDKEGELNRWVELQRDTLVFLAGLPQLQADATLITSEVEKSSTEQGNVQKRMVSLLASAIGNRSDFEELSVLSLVGGKVLVSTDPRLFGEYRVNDLAYTRGKDKTFVQNVYTSPVTGKPALTIATPLTASSGETVAVLAGNLNLTLVDRLMADSSGLGSTGEAYLVSRFNDFVSSERFGRDEYRRGVFSDGIDAALGEEHGVGVYLNYAGVPVIGAYRWNSERELALIVEMGQEEAFAPARRLVRAILGIGMASGFMFAGGVYFIARQIARPVLAVTQAATAVAEGKFTTVAPVLTTDEVGVLAKVFNEMTSRLRRLYTDLNEQVDATTDAMVALEKSRHLLQAIIDNSTTFIAVTDSEHRFLLLNKSFQSIIGIPQTAALGKTPRDLLPDNVAEAYLEAAKTVFDEKRVAEREVKIQVGSELRTYIVVCFPLRARQSEPYGVGMVATDLTEIVRAQEAHRVLEAQVQHAQKLESLGLMAGGIAHDFNNILTSLLGNTELALNSVEAGSSASLYLEKVMMATTRAADLTNQMLAYAGKASFHQEKIDLNNILGELTQLVRASISKKITFRCELTSEPFTIKANRAQIIQLVINLITNAAEAVGDRAGSVTVRTSRIDVLQDGASQDATARVERGPSVRLSVSDTGVGMDEETLARSFDPFFSTKGPGRGLGLAAVNGIVKSFGGELTVTSREGDGSTFAVDFPVVHESPPAIESSSSHEVRLEGRGTILVVDDEPEVRGVAKNLLVSAGFHVLEASNGLEAVETYRARGPEIEAVLLDMTMPGMSGAEALKAIREHDPSAYVILSSGYDEQDTIAVLKGEEHVEFLQKPYPARALFAKLAHVLAESGRVELSSAAKSSSQTQSE